MRALVVYESMFGNTRTIAEAVAEGLAPSMEVDTVEVGSAPSVLAGVDLLVVGGPTHAFSMSRGSTRKSAAGETDQALVSSGSGIREWLEGLSLGDDALLAATFDTKIATPRLPGSAAAAAQKRLRRLGARVGVSGETFLVDGVTGPLLAGERDRAMEWARHLGAVTRLPTRSTS